MGILVAILLYFALLMLISFFTGRNASNTTYFTANRRSPWYLVALGMVSASVTGVSFVSVPGWVAGTGFTYMQMALGFFVGYIVIAKVLLPVYYKFNFVTIYTYLQKRFGVSAYKTGASFFLLSKSVSAAARLYITILVLQLFVFERIVGIQLPFWLIVVGAMLLIGLYTLRSGIKTVIWTDALQTIIMIGALCLIIAQVMKHLNLVSLTEAVSTIANSSYGKMFEFDDWHSKQHFVKQFFSGIFVTIVMTGLDQDMMQKNLTCRTLRESQRNMYSYGFMFIPLNLLLLSLGALLFIFAQQQQIALPAAADQMLPTLVADGYLGTAVMYLFVLGLMAAAFSSVDSAVTSLSTSFFIDILGNKASQDSLKKRWTRMGVHVGFCVVFVLLVMLFNSFKNQSAIDTIYTIVSYTYGPLLGLFAFGLFTKRKPKDRYIPFIALLSPVLSWLINELCRQQFGYQFGYELLIMNGLFTFLGLWATSYAEKKENRR